MKPTGITILKQLLITFSIEVVIALACLIQSSSMTGYSVECPELYLKSSLLFKQKVILHTMKAFERFEGRKEKTTLKQEFNLIESLMSWICNNIQSYTRSSSST